MAKRLVSSSFREKFTVANKTSLQWFPGHMKKGLDQIQSSLRNIDAVLEVHDARIPFSGRNTQLRQVINIRPHILILNKCDLADLSRKTEILQKLKEEGVNNVQFTSCISRQILKNIREQIVPMILKDVTNHQRYRTDVLNQYNILVIGVPNVGKSTLLNKLMETYTTRRKCAQVGAMPGVTRSVMNRVKVNFDPEMFVVDTPGILNPGIPSVEVGMRLALCDCIPNHLVGPELIVDYLLFWLNSQQNFSYVNVYRLREPTDDVTELLSQVALGNKMVTECRDSWKTAEQKYRLDFVRAANLVIKDFCLGKFGKVMFDDDFLT